MQKQQTCYTVELTREILEKSSIRKLIRQTVLIRCIIFKGPAYVHRMFVFTIVCRGKGICLDDGLCKLRVGFKSNLDVGHL